MGLIGKTCQGDERCGSVSYPRHPTVMPVLLRDYSGHRKRRGGVAGRKTAAILEGALVLEPGIAKVAMRRNLARLQPAGNVLHREAENLRVGNSLRREQSRAAGVL